MKKFVIACSLMLVSVSFAATPFEHGSLKVSRLAFTPRTLAQIEALTADTTGQLMLCSDCTRSPLCISSGTVAPGAWVVITGTGPYVGSTYSGLPACQ